MSRLLASLWMKNPSPEPDQKVLERGESELEVLLHPVEGLREAPARIDAGHGADSLGGRCVVPAALPGVVGGQRRLYPFQEDEVVARALGRAAGRHDALHHVGVEAAPVEGLERAHGPAGHELDPLDPEHLGDQPVLQAHVVVGRHLGEARLVVGRRRVAGRRRETVAQHVRHDDEVLPGVEGLVLADGPLHVGVVAGVPGRLDDDVVLLGVQRAVGLVSELGAPQGRSLLQHHVARVENLVVAHSSFPLPHADGRFSPSWAAGPGVAIAHSV